METVTTASVLGLLTSGIASIVTCFTTMAETVLSSPVGAACLTIAFGAMGVRIGLGLFHKVINLAQN